MNNLVVASPGMMLPNLNSLAEVECTCGETATLQDNLDNPFCPHCGKTELSVLKRLDPEIASVSLSDNMELASIKCSGCSSNLILKEETASDFGGNINCVVCGLGLTFDNSELSKKTGKKRKSKKGITGKRGARKKKRSSSWGVGKDKKVGEKDTPEEASFSHSPLDSLSGINQVRFIKDGGIVHAFTGESQLASTYTKDNPVIARILESDDALMALASACSGVPSFVKSALVKNGFQLAKAHFDLDAVTATNIQTQVENAKLAVAEEARQDKASIEARLTHALSIACAGLDKGFFTTSGNTQTVSLMSILETAATSSNTDLKLLPEVAKLLPDYLASLISVTSELANKSDTLRNELATSIEQANVVLPTTKVNPLLTELTAGVKPTTASAVEEASPIGTTKIAQLALRAPLSYRN